MQREVMNQNKFGKMPVEIKERFESASLDGPAREIFPISLARPNAASGGEILPLTRALLRENLFPRRNQGRRRTYNSCDTEEGKTRPAFQGKGPGGAPPRDRLELLQRGPRRGKKFSPFKSSLIRSGTLGR